MANILADGTVIPAYLSVDMMGGHRPNKMFDDRVLRKGEVQELIYPTDVRSMSKTYIEYRVSVENRDNQGPGTISDYPNCVLINDLAGGADFTTYTLRANTVNDAIVGNGSKVLILCINGETSQAVIVGGLQDTPTVETKEDGHHRFTEFNGVRTEINDSGELTTTFKGATKADGTLRDDADANASGTTFQLTKDGSASLQHDGQSVTIDFPNKGLNLAADQTVNITGANIKVGGEAAVDALVRGTSYRTAEQTMHQTQLAALDAAISALGNVSAAISTAASAMAGVSAVPGSPLSPLAPAAAGLALAVPGIGAIVTALQTVAQSITTFESGSQPYLSSKHTVE